MIPRSVITRELFYPYYSYTFAVYTGNRTDESRESHCVDDSSFSLYDVFTVGNVYTITQRLKDIFLRTLYLYSLSGNFLPLYYIYSTF